MGAMHNDANRCTFMFSDDRRCRNLVETPGGTLCYFHGNRARKQQRTPPSEDVAARAFFQWLSTHPLDNATHANRALNLLLLLVAARRLSIRRADSLLRAIRVLMRSVPGVQGELYRPGLLEDAAPQQQLFLDEIAPLLAAAAAQDPQEGGAVDCGSPSAPLATSEAAAVLHETCLP